MYQPSFLGCAGVFLLTIRTGECLLRHPSSKRSSQEGHDAPRVAYFPALLGLAFFLASCSRFRPGFFLLGGAFLPRGAFPTLDFPLEGAFPSPGAFPILDFPLAGAFPFAGAFPLLAFAWTCEPCLDFGDFPEVARGVSPKQMVQRPTEKELVQSLIPTRYVPSPGWVGGKFFSQSAVILQRAERNVTATSTNNGHSLFVFFQLLVLLHDYSNQT